MKRCMEHSFWSSRWQSGRTGFHRAQVNPNLIEYWAELAGEEGRVLVPLCGKSNDLEWLAQRGHEVEGVEFVDKAVESFFEERQIEPERAERGGVSSLSKDNLRLVVGDFFRLSSEHVPACDWIYDRAALVAIAPERRRDYVQQLHRLSAPGAKMLLVNFVHDTGSGPPFSIETPELKRHCDSLFELELRSERDIMSEEDRFSDRGATFLLEQVWFCRRLE